ncbi:aminoglycoside phosphotransferase family protein [Kitasatospora sp. A2-31]|uniref:aminoglycoside phosphotransferase family protein n=1 Tax=Kitasatospora sp. A2-31 TaxID=2916414 RepID=UPI001EEAFB11|nr:aminoglycoside phosphotransferase family protein [Kitasatospora sp. A2-31]MCG6498455.1 aminoglycoside phosphotransferase family protein [Kitasatospora sp. A2-31]
MGVDGASAAETAVPADVAAVPADVRARLAVRFGASAQAWCDALPGLVAELAGRWGLTVRAAGGGGTARVFRCTRRDGIRDGGDGFRDGGNGPGDDRSAGDGGASVWLKLTPDPEVARQEAVALRAWAGLPSVVRVLEEDPTAGALLLADVPPGTTLRQRVWHPEEVTPLLGALRSVPVAGLALGTLAERVGFLFDLTERRVSGGAPGADGAPGAATAAAIGRARALAAQLADGGPTALVHGDLHPGNVLDGPAGPVAIDPRPSLGDPDFDLVDWAIDGVADRPGLERRIAALAARVPGSDPERVLAWCRVGAVMVAVPRAAAGRRDTETAFLLELAGL